MTAEQRVLITIRGAVQGVGFRPFVYRLAVELDIRGWVNNSTQGVTIDAEASSERLNAFVERLRSEPPPNAVIQHFAVEPQPPHGYNTFTIHHSEDAGAKTVVLLPDLATCPDCLREITDPTDRRYRYPFTNCTNCGPRFSIIRALPYDRPNTTLRDFIMCPTCRAEYENPLDRRFHAQPNACPICGPQIALWDVDGRIVAERDRVIAQVAAALRAGAIVAVKGLGGFHLMADTANAAAVQGLRTRKRREDKPFALLYPTLDSIRADCAVSNTEAALLTSRQAPIVLLRRTGGQIVDSVAPGNPYLGVMLPSNPLHHLLMTEVGIPLVATSGNLSGEPICIDEHEALTRLRGIADLFLVHNRPIQRHIDDSIVRITAGRPLMIRRARGYAPLPVELPEEAPTLIAVGAHQKNTVAVTAGRQVFISQHIGDMETLQAYDAFRHVLEDFRQMYDLSPRCVVCDLHPDYESSKYAQRLGLPVVRVQHHYAHALSCMAEHHLDAPALAVSWDGTGLGTDGTIWGGEFLRILPRGFTREAFFTPFRLPGGERAVREPRRTALGLLYALYGANLPEDLPPVQSFSPNERLLLQTALEKGLNAPETSSAGRLFDAVAALIGIRQTCTFEGQAAMELEFAAYGHETDKCYPFAVTNITGRDGTVSRMIVVTPMVEEIASDVRSGVSTGTIAAQFHNTLAALITSVAQQVGEPRVVLTGGCFQNVLLLEKTIVALRQADLVPYWHHLIPPNDGGLSLGQMIAGIHQCV